MTSYLHTQNLSLYTLPAAWFIALMPRVFAMRTFVTATGRGMDTTYPRGLAERAASDPALSSETKSRIIRAEAAQANGFENVGYFAAAVVAGNFAGVSKGWLNALSLGYLAARFVFNHAYIFGGTKGLAMLRTVVFFAGQGMVWTLFVMAGNRLR